jgi:3-oxoacyl-[acyl-carrier protein] reductase
MFEHVFNLNARAQFFIGQAAWKHLEDHCRLVLMSSVSAGKLVVKRHALYNSSKMAVIGMVKAFASDFGSHRITVNGIAPGGVLSDMFYKNCWNYIPGNVRVQWFDHRYKVNSDEFDRVQKRTRGSFLSQVAG